MIPKAAVFDIGNVLINWHPEAWYDAQIGQERRRAFLDAVPMDDLNLRSDKGESLTDLIEEAAREYPDWANEIRAWRNNFIEICAPAIDGTVAALKALKAQGTPVFTLTNFGDETFDEARHAYPFLDLFDLHFVSARLETIKPDPAFYRTLEITTGYSGPEIIFADDRPDNIDTARELGWQAHLFEGAEAWQEALEASGLLAAGRT
jgi:2-haloacid dehalogenase